MLVNLTPIESEIERIKQYGIDNNVKMFLQSELLFETGIYIDVFPHDFRYFEFEETQNNSWNKDWNCCLEFYKPIYGVADNIEQIKEYFKEEIESTERKYFISVTEVYQELENKGKGGGWRWHKWGEYIGKLDRKCEYLDDEEFGADFKCVMTFEIHPVA